MGLSGRICATCRAGAGSAQWALPVLGSCHDPGVDYLSHFRAECAAFEAAVRRSADSDDETPLIPACPKWSRSDLVAHLGGVQRYVTLVVSGLHMTPPDHRDPAYLGLPADIDRKSTRLNS